MVFDIPPTYDIFRRLQVSWVKEYAVQNSIETWMCSSWTIAEEGTYSVGVDSQSKATFTAIVYGPGVKKANEVAFLYSAAFGLQQLSYDNVDRRISWSE